MRTVLLSLGFALVFATGCNDSADWNGPIDDAIVVNPGESIQAAVDAAPAGATIRVNPGDYVETHGAREAVRITKPLTLVANSRIPESRVRILPATGQRQGILVEPENPTSRSRASRTTASGCAT
jgi:pectin methylesterase-like acyl-CoA thioesterase